MTQQTVLAPAHHLLQARMVDFHGWDMPLHYGSQLEEHHAVRRDCGMFDISHMCTVDVSGLDARAFLLRLLANNIDKLQQPGRALYGCMLNEAGGVLDDLIVYLIADGRYRLVVNSATANSDIAWMAARATIWQMAVAITPRRDLAMLAVQGPQARDKVWQALPQTRAASSELAPFSAVQADEYFIARTGYTGEDGFEISLPAAQAPALWQSLLALGVTPCGLGARDTLRLEAGMNLYGQDMDAAESPRDVGLGWTVDLASGRDFVGRDALLARPQYSQLLGLVLSGGGVLRALQKVSTPHGDGIITSGTFSPTMQQSIALARLPPAVAVGDEVTVNIRERPHAARVVKPPFVRNGRILV
jgi:aminomethyltransferase